MACCKCCCGKKDCEEGEEGKCCCGGPGGTCCQAGEFCCNGTCAAEPCDDPAGACCLYEFEDGEWALVSCTDTTQSGCTAGTGQYASFKPGQSCDDSPCADEPGACCVYEIYDGDWYWIGCTNTTSSECTAATGEYPIFKQGKSCDDTPSPCLGVQDPSGSCCDGAGQCLRGGPGVVCEPTNDPNECFCDVSCYVACFDCCNVDATTCCSPAPEVFSLWDVNSTPLKVQLHIASLEQNLAAYGVDMDEAWGAAMQCGTCIDGYFHMLNCGRLSLVLCLQDLAAGRLPWLALQDHQARVRGTAGAMRVA